MSRVSSLLVVATVCLLAFAEGCAAQEKRRTKDQAILAAFPEERLAKLRDPIPGRPIVKSPLTKERVEWVCQFGNLRMMSFDAPTKDDIQRKLRADNPNITEAELGKRVDELFAAPADAFQQQLKKFKVTFMTHAAGGAAVSWSNRYKTLEGMVSNSLWRRPTLRLHQDCGVVTIPYADYQRLVFAKDADGIYLKWPEFRQTWGDVFGPLPQKIDELMGYYPDGKPIELYPGVRYEFTLAAEHALLRAFYAIGVDVNNGADGLYFDCGGFSPRGDYGPEATKAFQKYLAEKFTPEQRQELFGTADVAPLTPVKAITPPGAQQPVRDPPALRPEAVTPLAIAWMRFRCWQTGQVLEKIAAFGRTVNPNFVMMNTYWSHAGDPWVPIVGIANDIEEVTKDGRRNTFLFWEPGTNGPGVGRGTREEAKAAAEAEAAKANKPVEDFRFGRRSFSGSLKQMVGASYVPVVSKQSPSGGTSDLTELLFAQNYANLVTPRTGPGDPFNADGIIRMHTFQEAHPDFFVGARPYPRVALLCSESSLYGLRSDSQSVFFSRKLMDMGLEHQIIPERKLTPEGLANFELLFVYKAALLSEAQMKALEAFKKDRTLVVIGESGTYDEWGRPRKGGLARLVGDLPAKATEAQPAVSEDGRVIYCPDGALTKSYGDFWYRHGTDGDESVIKAALEKTSYGKAWPYLAPNRPHTVEIHLHEIPAKGRILAQVVNYDVTGELRPYKRPEGLAPAEVMAMTPEEKEEVAKTGQAHIQPTPPMELAVKLHGNKTPTRATLVAPELVEKTKDLTVKVEQRYGAPYAVVQVPSVRIYAIIAID